MKGGFEEGVDIIIVIIINTTIMYVSLITTLLTLPSLILTSYSLSPQ